MGDSKNEYKKSIGVGGNYFSLMEKHFSSKCSSGVMSLVFGYKMDLLFSLQRHRRWIKACWVCFNENHIWIVKKFLWKINNIFLHISMKSLARFGNIIILLCLFELIINNLIHGWWIYIFSGCLKCDTYILVCGKYLIKEIMMNGEIIMISWSTIRFIRNSN